MKYKWDKKYLHIGITAFLVILACVLSVLIIFRWDIVTGLFGWAISILMPIIYGIVIAFLLDPFVRLTRRLYLRIFRKKLEKIKDKPKKIKRLDTLVRAIGIVLAILIVLGAIVGLIMLIIPQLINSLSMMFDNIQVYVNNFTDWLNGFMSSDSAIASALQSFVGEGFSELGKMWDTTIMPMIQDFAGEFASGALGFVMAFKDIILGLVIAIYLMLQKEKFIGRVKMVLYSCMKKERANKLINIGSDANKYFGNYIIGQILDSLLVGVVCFIVMSIFQFDYALLISVVVAVTNIIPFFGPFIGGIPSAFLLLLVDPIQCLMFIIWILILQQIDGNIICPLIQGNRTGISGFWVITSITVFGGIFGMVGIILAVPSCAVLLVIIRRRVARGLKRRKMEYDLSVYMHEGTIFESDDTQVVVDESLPTPIKSITVQRPPVKEEKRQTSKYVQWAKKKFLEIHAKQKEKKGNNKKK